MDLIHEEPRDFPLRDRKRRRVGAYIWIFRMHPGLYRVRRIQTRDGAPWGVQSPDRFFGTFDEAHRAAERYFHNAYERCLKKHDQTRK